MDPPWMLSTCLLSYPLVHRYLQIKIQQTLRCIIIILSEERGQRKMCHGTEVMKNAQMNISCPFVQEELPLKQSGNAGRGRTAGAFETLNGNTCEGLVEGVPEKHTPVKPPPIFAQESEQQPISYSLGRGGKEVPFLSPCPGKWFSQTASQDTEQQPFPSNPNS